MTNLPKYVVVTPARNEAQFIELTLKSMAAQTVPPVKWVVVSDGSTDGTDELVKKYAAQYPWIELLRMPERKERHFAGKVHAFNAGYAQVKALPYDAIVSLDGDLSFEPEYFAYLLDKLASDSTIGLVGTPFQEASNQAIYDYRYVSIEHVSGACQMFRRECFEQIGGYVPIKGGGIDHVAVISARMKGWKTRTFTDKVSLHHRTMGTAERSPLMAGFKTGGRDYALGGHPLWEIFRTFYQMSKKPYILGGAVLGAGYLWAVIKREERPISKELMAFRRREQMARLKRFLAGNRLPAQSRPAASS